MYIHQGMKLFIQTRNLGQTRLFKSEFTPEVEQALKSVDIYFEAVNLSISTCIVQHGIFQAHDISATPLIVKFNVNVDVNLLVRLFWSRFRRDEHQWLIRSTRAKSSLVLPTISQ